MSTAKAIGLLGGGALVAMIGMALAEIRAEEKRRHLEKQLLDELQATRENMRHGHMPACLLYPVTDSRWRPCAEG